MKIRDNYGSYIRNMLGHRDSLDYLVNSGPRKRHHRFVLAIFSRVVPQQRHARLTPSISSYTRRRSLFTLACSFHASTLSRSFRHSSHSLTLNIPSFYDETPLQLVQPCKSLHILATELHALHLPPHFDLSGCFSNTFLY